MDIEKVCCFNKNIDCNNHECFNCGWNPDVASERINQILIKRRLEANSK